MTEYDITINRLRDMQSWNGFARSLLRQWDAKGELSVPQWQAAERMIAKMDANKAKRDKLTREVDFSAITALFGKAKASGLKRPKLHFGDRMLSMAGDRSRNPGAVYVKDSGVYMGKVMGGKFSPSRDADDEVATFVENLAKMPGDAILKHGKESGQCACCGRPLTDPTSLARGVGPVCAERWGI